MQRDFPRQLGSLESLYEFAEEILEASHIPPAVRFPVHLAMEELFVNMVKYNPGVATDITVDVGVTVTDKTQGSDGPGQEVTVTLVDSGGVEFDVTAERRVEIDVPLERRTPGGLGIHLIQNLVDELEYNYRDGRGEVKFTKRSGNENV